MRTTREEQSRCSNDAADAAGVVSRIVLLCCLQLPAGSALSAQQSLLVLQLPVLQLPAEQPYLSPQAGELTATQNPAPAPSPAPATQNPAPVPAPAPATQNPVPAPSPAPSTQNPVPVVDVLLDSEVQSLQGKPIRFLRVLQLDSKKGLLPMSADEAEAITRGLLLRAGQPFEARKAKADTENLWHERRLAIDIRGQLTGDQVEIYLLVLREVQVFERLEFQGLVHLERFDVDALLGLYVDRQVTSVESVAMRNVLVARYRRDGYAFASVTIDERDPLVGESSSDRLRMVAIFRIDEGPKVTIRRLSFRGNVSFPSEPVLGLFGAGDYLARDSHILSDPAGTFASGGAYSRELIEEDLDRLRLFYRARGFLDASVTLADQSFTTDRTQVDLDVQVVEGQQYRIQSVRVVYVDAQQREIAAGAEQYPMADVVAVLKAKAGAFYNYDQIRRDQRAIEEYYGRRGHPAISFPGMDKVVGAFRVGWPRERYTSDAKVEITFEIFEGTPKSLREVLIRGNQYSRDKVIRRKVYAMPGERIDMSKVQRSINYLRDTRFFQDPISFEGPRYELLPVGDNSDVLDLAIDVKDGQTGEFRWGIGISTGAGASASFEFNKRNFDIWNPPTSLNPVTMFDEILSNRAFHGGGQNLTLLAAPGTQISQFAVGFIEPDLFGQQFDTISLSVNGRKRTRRYGNEGYTTDTLGADVEIARNFTEEFSTGIRLRDETVDTTIDQPNVVLPVVDAEGSSELRGMRFRTAYTDYDSRQRPTAGGQLALTFEVLGGPFGADQNMWKGTASSHVYTPVRENELGHKYILHWEQFFGLAQAYADTDDVFLTERFYMGGGDLRGFDFRGAGPTQFGLPYGGDATYRSSVELSIPLVATRMERDLLDRELLRGVLFTDFGLLGLSLSDPTFNEPRLNVGFGLRIEVPVLEIPIAIDLGWPILFEQTDDRRQFYFSIAR